MSNIYKRTDPEASAILEQQEAEKAAEKASARQRKSCCSIYEVTPALEVPVPQPWKRIDLPENPVYDSFDVSRDVLVNLQTTDQCADGSALSGDMNTRLKAVLHALTHKPEYLPFSEPVPKAHLEYYERITRPMDFGTITQKVDVSNFM